VQVQRAVLGHLLAAVAVKDCEPAHALQI